MSQTTKRQHYVAQSYLRGFTMPHEETDKLLWVYEKLPNRPPRQRSVKSVAYREFYYAQEDDDGNILPDLLEKSFKDVEDTLPNVIERIVTQRQSGLCKLTGDEAAALVFFVSLSHFRVPSFRDAAIKLWEWGASQVAHQVIPEMRKKGEIPEVIEELIDQDKIGIKVKEWVTIKPMVMLATEMAHGLLRKPRQILIADPSVKFLTSDNPVTFIADVEDKQLADWIGPNHPRSEVRMPLNRDFAVIYTPLTHLTEYQREKSHGLYTQLTEKQTRGFNKSTVHAAQRFVFADRKTPQLERLVKNSIGTEQKLLIQDSPGLPKR